MDKLTHRIGHKENCQCSVCKAIRGERKGKTIIKELNCNFLRIKDE